MRSKLQTVVLLAVAALALVSAGCGASVNGKLAVVTSQAITVNEQLHCGAPKAPQPPLCLSDAQFHAVAADLNKVSLAGLAYTQAVEAAQKAKQQPPAEAFVTMVAAVSQAFSDIQQILGPELSARILGDAKHLLGSL